MQEMVAETASVPSVYYEAAAAYIEKLSREFKCKTRFQSIPSSLFLTKCNE